MTDALNKKIKENIKHLDWPSDDEMNEVVVEITQAFKDDGWTNNSIHSLLSSTQQTSPTGVLTLAYLEEQIDSLNKEASLDWNKRNGYMTSQEWEAKAIDAGWIMPRKPKRNGGTIEQIGNGPIVLRPSILHMTGQEWFDRFRAKLHRDASTDPAGVMYYAALLAAKKAAGIES